MCIMPGTPGGEDEKHGDVWDWITRLHDCSRHKVRSFWPRIHPRSVLLVGYCGGEEHMTQSMLPTKQY